jgi:two-component system cell cycle response regulator DivK
MATILLVEDDAATRELLRALLEQEGQSVLEAGTALEALTVAGVTGPDLILLDLRLPDAHGFERCLRLEPWTASVPILALTAYPGDHVAEALVQSGCMGYLTKPVSREILLEALRHYLAGDWGSPGAKPQLGRRPPPGPL